jgi:hypothetical protein
MLFLFSLKKRGFLKMYKVKSKDIKIEERTTGMMKRNHCIELLRQQEGSVLLLALVVMAALSIVGITSLNISNTEQQITGNVQRHKMAFYNADAGVQYTLARIKADLINGDDIDTSNYDDDIEDLDDFDFTISQSLSFANTDENIEHTFETTGKSPSGLAECSIKVTFTYELSHIDPKFQSGLLCEGAIELGTQTTILENSTLHSNHSISTNKVKKMEDNVFISTYTDDGIAQSLEDATPAWTGEGEDYHVEVPSPNDIDEDTGETHLDYYKKLVDLKVKFIDGDYDVEADDLSIYDTIVATGDITFNGAPGFDINGGVAFIAGGDITVNGASQSVAFFWAGGKFKFHGNATVEANIVAQGFTQSGQVTYKQPDNDIDNPHLPQIDLKINTVSWANTALLQ